MKETSILIVDGMTCGLCPIIIENTLKNMEGIIEVHANYASEKCTVTYDNEKVSFEDIKKRLEGAGYYGYSQEEYRSLNKVSEADKLKKKLIYAVILASPMILLMLCNGGTGCCISFPSLNDSKFSKFIELMGYRVAFLKDWRIQILLATPIQFIIGSFFYKKAFASLKAKMLNMDVLVVLGTTVTYFYSAYISFFGETNVSGYKDVYFESSIFVIVFVLLGKYLEEKTKCQTTDAIKSLIDIQPSTANIVVGGKEKEINIDEVNVGDIVLVRPGEKIPCDGEVVYGVTDVDESMFTGESIPVKRTVGDLVIGSSINLNGTVKVKVNKVGEDTKIREIIRLVEEAQNSRIKIQSIVDKVSSIFVPAIILISIITFIVWYFIIFNGVRYFLPKSLLYSVSVLVVACPCALGLATPAAIVAGIGRCAKDGILIKNSESLDMACSLDTIIFDKTGTITTGKIDVEKFIFFNEESEEDKKDILKLIGIAEKNSEHYIGKAIYNKISKEIDLFKYEIDQFDYSVGKGIKASYKSNEVIIGNRLFLKENNVKNMDSVKIRMIGRFIEESRKSYVIAAVNKEIKAIIILNDEIRESAKEAIKLLKERNIEVVMLTGDNKRCAEKIAHEVGINNVISNVLPSEKNDYIKSLKKQGKKVGMVGDGINDAAALPESHVGFSMGNGSEIAIESGDIVLLNNNLKCIVEAIDMSKRINKKIKQNLFFAFIYNIAAVPIAACGNLTPAIACIAMSISSLSVLMNSLRLKKKYKLRKRDIELYPNDSDTLVRENDNSIRLICNEYEGLL